MKVFKKVGGRRLLLLVPLTLIVVFMIATSVPFLSGVASAYMTGGPVPPPGPFPPAPTPEGPDAILGTADDNYDSYMDMTALNTLLANDANRGNVRMIDVRSSYEYLADVCPMQIALGMPTYTVTNVGHPVWNWPGPDGIPGNGDDVYEEAYSDPYWIGFFFAGSPGNPNNIRMEENPNFHDYFGALMADGTITPGDRIVVLCQTGYRASFAGMEIKAMSDAYGWGLTVDVLYGGMLAWSDDWLQDDGSYCADLATDPSPDDDGTLGLPPYFTPVPWPDTAALNCDPDNVPGPAARAKTTALAAPWKYDTARLALVGAPTIWNGTEPHVAVKPEWLGWAGHGDSALSAAKNGVYWASSADYTAGLLSVDFKITNNEPLDVTPAVWPSGGLPFPYSMNYAAACGGKPVSAGGACEDVNQAAHGTAYNTMVLNATGTNGVTPASALPMPVGDIAPTSNGTATIKYNIPTGVTFFVTNLWAMSTDVPDPTASWPAGYNDPFHTPLMEPIFGTALAPWPQTGMGWYGVSAYPGPPPTP